MSPLCTALTSAVWFAAQSQSFGSITVKAPG